MELWSIEAIKASVQSNIGVAYLPRFTVEKEIKQGALKIIPTQIENFDFTTAFSYKAHKMETAALELFKRLLKEKIN